jgi:hypothetical protein
MKQIKVRLSSFGYKIFQRQAEEDGVGVSDLIRRELSLKPSHRLQLEVKAKKSSAPALQRRLSKL